MTSAPRRQPPAAAALSCLVSPLGADADECSRCGSSRRRLGGWPSSQASRSAKPRSCRLCSAHGHGPSKSSTISATSGGVRPPSCIRRTSPSHGSVVRLLIITTLLPPSRANAARNSHIRSCSVSQAAGWAPFGSGSEHALSKLSQINGICRNLLPHGLWADWRGKHDTDTPRPITQGIVAKLLTPFGIRPAPVWPLRRGADTRSSRGYYRHQFEDAWRRYCPSADDTPTHSSNVKSLRGR